MKQTPLRQKAQLEEISMKKAITVAIAALAIAGTMAASVTDASARNRGGAVAAGVIGGLAAGAIIGGALANRPAYAAPQPYYAPAPVYVQPRCWTERQRVWDPYVGVWRTQRVRVCD
jgi:hypothetical protein